MNIDANDPKWTAYALGEIMDESERLEIEAILKQSAEAQQLVEEIRQTAGLLKMELQAEPAIYLTQAQKMRIWQRTRAGTTWLGLRPVWAMASAAVVIVLVSFIALRQFNQSEIVPESTQIAASIPNEPMQDQGGDKEIASGYLAPPDAAAKSQADKKPAMVDSVSSGQKSATAAPAIVFEKNTGAAPSEIIASTAAEKLMMEAGSSAGTVLKEQAVNQLPPSKNAADLTKIMGGAVKSENPILSKNEQAFAGLQAESLNVQRDGITVADVRYKSGLVSPNRLNPGAVGELKVIPFPVDAEMRGRYRQGKPGKPGDKSFNTEAYDSIQDNPFLEVLQNPLSTFSIDVDTASYSNVRRFLDSGKLPPKDAVRIEELVNYFDYDYKSPRNGKPFAANFELTEAPWNPEHKLLRIGLKGREISEGKRPDGNLVFLLDVSGSMADENKLPLVKEAMGLLVDRLTESDQVAIVVYASDTRLWMPSTSGDQKQKIRSFINRLHAGGSTNGGSGIQMAYQTAKENFIKGGVNRVILATDGDFNVGVTNQGDLSRLIEEKAKSGIYLSALGFGMGNYKDSTLEMLARKGHGNYAYIDQLNEAKKVFVEQINSTLVAIAKDVKIQVEFNPRHVSAYRLLGYEDRLMAKEDFNNDAKEAGVIGAGHAVTALYELVPSGVSDSRPGVDPLKYQKPGQTSASADSNELVTVKIRSKEPEKDTSVLTEFTAKDSAGKFSRASQDFKFAAAVAAFGMVLRDSPYKGNANLESALEWAKEGKGIDKYGYRQEFIRLVHRAFSISD